MFISDTQVLFWAAIKMQDVSIIRCLSSESPRLLGSWLGFQWTCSKAGIICDFFWDVFALSMKSGIFSHLEASSPCITSKMYLQWDATCSPSNLLSDRCLIRCVRASVTPEGSANRSSRFALTFRLGTASAYTALHFICVTVVITARPGSCKDGAW